MTKITKAELVELVEEVVFDVIRRTQLSSLPFQHRLEIRNIAKDEIVKYDRSRDACDKAKGYRHKHDTCDRHKGFAQKHFENYGRQCPYSSVCAGGCFPARRPIQEPLPFKHNTVWSARDDVVLRNSLELFLKRQGSLLGRTPGAVRDRIINRRMPYDS